MISWVFRDHQLLGSLSADPVENGCYPMAPWAGRIHENHIDWNAKSLDLEPSYQEFALHGLLLDQPVKCAHKSESGDAASIEFTAAISDWCAPLRIVMQWRLSADRVESKITALTDSIDPVPVVLGWHPWFVNSLGASENLVLQVDSAQLAVREGLYPTGEFRQVLDFDSPFDDCFRIPSRKVHLRWGTELHVEIRNSHDWFVIYNGAPGVSCVEPQTGPPNAFAQSLGCDTLTTSAGHPLAMSTTWSLGISSSAKPT